MYGRWKLKLEKRNTIHNIPVRIEIPENSVWNSHRFVNVTCKWCNYWLMNHETSEDGHRHVLKSCVVLGFWHPSHDQDCIGYTLGACEQPRVDHDQQSYYNGEETPMIAVNDSAEPGTIGANNEWRIHEWRSFIVDRQTFTTGYWPKFSTPAVSP